MLIFPAQYMEAKLIPLVLMVIPFSLVQCTNAIFALTPKGLRLELMFVVDVLL